MIEICHSWMQEKTTDRQGPLRLPRCTTVRDDKRIVCLTVVDHSAKSKTTAQQIQIHSTIRCPLVPFVAEWNVRKASIALFTLHWKPQEFSPPMV
ncbi:hypothetical protein TNCV_138561 [Trichonephila clavipes]|nr:hypothetical protein TNCV_4175391 [Trichonephila clavipes]GFX02280.1 hypothetical protein TNCV_138561 [Trichonephila clavipes]